MESGGIALLNYGEVPELWHTRLLLHQTNGANWIIATPDMDVYEEEMDAGNVDLAGFYYSGPDGHVPGHINPARIYGFAPLTPAELGQLMMQGRVMAANMGVVIGAAAVAAPVVAPVAAPAPPVAAGGGGAVEDTWVAMEKVGPHSRRDVIATDPNPLPAGHVTLGNRAIIPVGQEFLSLRKMKAADVAGYALEDLRVLPVQFDAEGTRRREFSSVVERLNGDPPQGGGLQLTGPATCLKHLRSLRDQGFTPITFHEHWIRSSDISKGDRSTFEHECLSRILESLLVVDQVNAPSLQSAELLCRRMLVIREAHRINPNSPDYSAADIYMGWRFRKSGQGYDPALAAHVAEELKAEASIAKEARKAREEQNLKRRQGPGKKGEGGAEKS